MTAEIKHPVESDIQERMWIEIIATMDTMYARLAAGQTEMEQKNEELLRANEVVRNVIRSMINAFVVSDRSGRITLANDACLVTLGCRQEDLVGKPLGALFPTDARNAIFPRSIQWEVLLEAGSIRDVETQMLHASGQTIPMSVNASVIRGRSGDMDGALLVAYDMRPLQKALAKTRAEAEEMERAYRELKALQVKLIQSEKMSSLGRMAAGVAHEINNPLGSILVYSHLLLEDAPPDAPEKETLQKIIRETTRCKEIVQELLGFSRTQQGKRRGLDLSKVVETTLRLVRPQPLFHEVERTIDFAPGPLHVEAEQGLLQQAIMNILVNAAEAMDGKGRITVRTYADERRRTANVSIADTGPGIPAELMNELFEPFFTTKEEGHGTGLGLSITYNIVQQHGGTIEVRSRPGEGAEIVISLPLCAAEEIHE
jgi:two-component system, NtrC family, sensor kinase